MSQSQIIPRNILINVTPTAKEGPTQTVPPHTIRYVFASDPPLNALIESQDATVVLDEQGGVHGLGGAMRWNGYEMSQDGEVCVLQGVRSTKAAIADQEPTLASLVERFSYTQTFLRDVVDAHRPT